MKNHLILTVFFALVWVSCSIRAQDELESPTSLGSNLPGPEQQTADMSAPSTFVVNMSRILSALT